MDTKNLPPQVRTKAKKVLNLAVKSKRSMKLNEMNFARTSTFVKRESKRISEPAIDRRKLKKLVNTDFYNIASQNLNPNKGGGGPLGLIADLLGGLGGGGGRRGGRRGGPPSRRVQQRYRRRFGNRAANRRFRVPGRGIRGAGGVLGVAMAGLEYGGRLSEGQTQTQAITGTAASTAGGIAGAYAGAKGGALLGAGIGALFGGVGAVPGAAIGGFLGGIAGGFGGSMLAGGAADRLTGVVGKDKDREESEEKLEKESKINPLEMTLVKFDQVVERFSKAIVNLNFGSTILPDDDTLEAAIEKYGLETVIALLETQLRGKIKAEAKEKTLKEAKKAGFLPLQNVLGEEAYHGLMKQVFFEIQPEAKEPDATTKLLTDMGVPEAAQPSVEMIVGTLLSGGMMKRGMPYKVPTVRTRPLTKPTALQGPELPPVQGPKVPVQGSKVPVQVKQPISQPRVVRSADTLPRPEVKPTEPLVRQPAQTVQDVLNRNRRGRLKRTIKEIDEKQMRSQAELDAARDIVEGSLRKPEATVKPQQNLIEGKTTVEDGSTVFFRRLSGRSGAARRKKLKSTKTSSGTQTDGETQVMPRQPVDKVRQAQLENIRRANEQAQRDLEIYKETQKKIQPPKPVEQASINQYTTYNAPNNTTIIMQQGGGQMPPQSPPPQMMASAPPPAMPPGPSAIDVVTNLNTVIFLNNLQTT